MIATEKATMFIGFDDILTYYSVHEKKNKGDKVYDCALSVYMQDVERQIVSRWGETPWAIGNEVFDFNSSADEL